MDIAPETDVKSVAADLKIEERQRQSSDVASSCNVSPAIGLIAGSHQHIHRRFTPDAGGAPEAYGLDAGFAPTSGLHHGALRGNYAGANADASLGLGAGARVLVGGPHRTISL